LAKTSLLFSLARRLGVSKILPSHIFRIAGSQWQWVYRNLRRRKLCGKVSICKTLNGFDRLDTELHEALHACQGFASEDHVAETATTLATILWRLGYRLPGEHDGSDHKSA
jgi:hypothetical protein